jgi:hypothetical protein
MDEDLIQQHLIVFGTEGMEVYKMAENKNTDGKSQPWYEKAYNAVAGFWNFMDGKKNKIGNAALAVYGVAEAAVQMGIIPEYTAVAHATLYAGVAFKLLGMTHKAVKGELALPEGLRKTKSAEE